MKLRKGFTLVELLVVVAIIGILVLIAVPRFQSMTDGARRRTAEANHRIIVSAVTMFIANNNGAMPTDPAQLTPFMSPTFAELNGPAGGPAQPAGAIYTFTPGTVDGRATVTITTTLDGNPVATWAP